MQAGWGGSRSWASLGRRGNILECEHHIDDVPVCGQWPPRRRWTWRQRLVKLCTVGSPEHKDAPSFAGHPRPRADASICDPAFAERQHELMRWLRQAIRAGSVSEYAENGFPR